MKTPVALLAAVVLAGCTTVGQWREEAATPGLVASMAGVSSATFTLSDGRVERITTIRDFGDALCGTSACVRKSEIAKIGYAPRNLDVGGSLLAVPLLPVVAIGKAMLCYPSCGYGDRPPEGPKATPEQMSRAWLESLVIRDGLIVFVGKDNVCVPPAPASLDRDFATDAEAFAWIIAHRTTVPRACLAALGEELYERDRWASTKTYRQAAMQVDVLLAVRDRWNDARCKRSEREPSRFRDGWERVTPEQKFDLAAGKGDPALLAIIEQTLADPGTYAFDGDLDKTCGGGVLPPSEWPEKAAWARAASPFSPSSVQ